MTRFILGAIIGSLLTGSLGLAASLYDRQGQPSAPRGSIESFDYFRSRQAQIDIGHLRQQADRDRLERMTKPCAR